MSTRNTDRASTEKFVLFLVVLLVGATSLNYFAQLTAPAPTFEDKLRTAITSHGGVCSGVRDNETSNPGNVHFVDCYGPVYGVHFDATGKADYADKMPVYITPENYRRKH